jgi:hypothetical protein
MQSSRMYRFKDKGGSLDNIRRPCSLLAMAQQASTGGRPTAHLLGMLARVSVPGQSKISAERGRLEFSTRDEPAVADLHRRKRQAAGECVLGKTTNAFSLRSLQSRSSFQFMERQETCHAVPILSEAFSMQILSALEYWTRPGSIRSPSSAYCCSGLNSRSSLIWENLVVIYVLSFQRVQDVSIFLQEAEMFFYIMHLLEQYLLQCKHRALPRS